MIIFFYRCPFLATRTESDEDGDQVMEKDGNTEKDKEFEKNLDVDKDGDIEKYSYVNEDENIEINCNEEEVEVEKKIVEC